MSKSIKLNIMYHTFIIGFYPIAIWWFDDNFCVNNIHIPIGKYCVFILNIYYVDHKLIVNWL